MSERVFLVGFSAVIGVGKTSLIERLKKTCALQRALKEEHGLHPFVVFVLEPEGMWEENINGVLTNWLQEFYKDRDMNAHPFQTIVFDTHVTVVEEAVQKAREECAPGQDIVIVVERTMYDQLLFWKLQVDDALKTTTPIFDAAYMKIWKRWCRFIPQVSLIFFLKTRALRTTMERLSRRQGGDGVPLEYQQKLLKKHESWYTEPAAFPPNCTVQGGVPCRHIEMNAPFHEDDGVLYEMAKEMAMPLAKIIED